MTPKNPNDPNIVMLERVANRLGAQLCEGLIFVGGAAAGLLITDLALPAIRRTDDVDLVTSTQALEEYHQLEDHLRKLGFAPDMSPDAPLCHDGSLKASPWTSCPLRKKYWASQTVGTH
jgi:predicted nucleotidyltransferase